MLFFSFCFAFVTYYFCFQIVRIRLNWTDFISIGPVWKIFFVTIPFKIFNQLTITKVVKTNATWWHINTICVKVLPPEVVSGTNIFCRQHYIDGVDDFII